MQLGTTRKLERILVNRQQKLRERFHFPVAKVRRNILKHSGWSKKCQILCCGRCRLVVWLAVYSYQVGVFSRNAEVIVCVLWITPYSCNIETSKQVVRRHSREGSRSKCREKDSRFARVSSSGVWQTTLLECWIVWWVDLMNSFQMEKSENSRGKKDAGLEVALSSSRLRDMYKIMGKYICF